MQGLPEDLKDFSADDQPESDLLAACAHALQLAAFALFIIGLAAALA